MKFKKHNHSIVYINFAPYENTGNIRDYILETYNISIIFLFNFHRLTKLDQPSIVSVYKRKKRIFHARLFQTPTIPSLAFISLPIRSLVIFLQILFHTIRFQMKYGVIDDFFTVNAFIAWTGIILKKLGLVKRTIFWVWDYYPPIHKSKIIMFMRWMYWYFDKQATTGSDRIIYLNQRMVDVRKKLHILNTSQIPIIVPIGTNTIKRQKLRNKFALVFLGVVKKSQGLDLFFDSLPYLKTLPQKLSLHVIGGGPDESHYQTRAALSHIPIYFHGYESDDSKVDLMLSGYGIGIATYIPDPSNVSYWGEPSKIKRYLSAKIPVITTDVFEFSKTITTTGCGIVIPYKPRKFSSAVKKILSRYTQFQSATKQISERFHYRNIYWTMFT